MSKFYWKTAARESLFNKFQVLSLERHRYRCFPVNFENLTLKMQKYSTKFKNTSAFERKYFGLSRIPSKTVLHNLHRETLQYISKTLGVK